MLISIVVPVYNVEKYLQRCIDSILAQTFPDFELILVDDGSTDNSGKICDEYAKKDQRIVVVHQENRGQSLSRNLGISLAKGDYITFIDSDDFILPHFLEYLYKECTNAGADMSICGFSRYLDKDDISSVIERMDYKSESYEKTKMEEYLVSSKITNTVWGKLYKKSIVCDFKFPNRKYCEDVFSTYMLIHASKRIVFFDYNGYVYRNNLDSVMNEKYSPQKKDGIYISVERARFMEQNYPDLAKYAYRGVIYSCNQVLLCMGRSRVIDAEILVEMQRLYRNYVKYYLQCKTSVSGKLFALFSFFNVRLGLFVARFL